MGWQEVLLVALVLEPMVMSITAPVIDCTTGTVDNCNCVDVAQESLTCKPEEKSHWVFESQLKSDSKTTDMTLKCDSGINSTLLDHLESVGVDRSASFKMVGCSSQTSDSEETLRCTPVHSKEEIGLLKRFWNFISFSYTYTSTTTLRQLDLVGCTAIQEPESLERVKTLMKVDAIRLFGFEGVDRLVTFVKFFYYGTKQFQVNSI